MGDAIILVGALGLSALLTWLFRFYAVSVGLIDKPNRRSSHAEPTPRGGGLSIVLTFGVLLLLQSFLGELPGQVLATLLAAGAAVGIVGFVDDHRHVSPLARIVVHVISASLVVYFLGGLPPLQIGGGEFDIGWLGHVLAVIFVVWLINLFNFMDGIDGIAATEAIFIAIAALLIGGTDTPRFLAVLEIGLAASCLGFLFWNWPPARIFMGDVGSGFLGLVLGALALLSLRLGIVSVWAWLIIGGAFIVDATVTVVRRALAGEKWYSAHRSHAYQRLARRFGSHRRVTLLVSAVNVLWLFPMAYASMLWPAHGWWLYILAWLPLLVATVSLGAGRSDHE